MRKTVGELAEYLGARASGDETTEITGVKGLLEASPGDITFVASRKNRKYLSQTKASAVVVEDGTDVTLPYIETSNPYLAFARLLELFFPESPPEPHVHTSAVLGRGVKLGQEVAIGPLSYVGDDAIIGERTVVGPGSSVGKGCQIGAYTTLNANVTLYPGVCVGDRVIVHSGAVIGSDGFGFARREDGTHHKIPQVGNVVIEDDVEIGACVCIDRATLGETCIRRGAKIDNLVHIGHNVVIGEHALVLAQVGFSGSCEVGRGAVIAGQAGVIDHVTIGDGAVIIAQSGITEDIPAGAFFSGSPAVPHMVWKRMQRSLPKLPELVKTIRHLEKRIDELGKKSSAQGNLP